MNLKGRLHFLIMGGALVIASVCQTSLVLADSIVTSLGGRHTVHSSRSQVIEATASDPNGVTKVEFYVNKKLICTVTKAPYNCSWSVPAGAGVQYHLQTKAYDAKGLEGSSSVVTVTSD